MNLKHTFVLALVFMALGTLAMYSELKIKPKRIEVEEKAKQIFWLQDKNFYSIQLKNSHGFVKLECKAKECRLEKNPSWQITMPPKPKLKASMPGPMESDTKNIIAFLSGIIRLAPLERIKIQAKNWKEKFGFNPPEMALELQLKDPDERISFWIGDKAAIGDNYYVHTNRHPETVFVVPKFIYLALNRDLFFWRDKRLFANLPTEKISHFRWKHSKKEKVDLVKPQNNWLLKQSQEIRANDKIINGLLSSLKYLEVRKILDEELDAKGLQKWLTISASETLQEFDVSSSKINIVLDIFQKENKFFAKSNQRAWWAEVNADSFQKFIKGYDAIRRKDLLEPAKYRAVKKLSLRFQKNGLANAYTFKREQEAWHPEQKNIQLDQTKMRKFLSAIISPEVSYFDRSKKILDRWQNGLDVILDLKDKDNKDLLSLQFSTSKYGTLVNGEINGEVRVMNKSFVRSLPLALKDLIQ